MERPHPLDQRDAARGVQPLLGGLTLRRGRVHHACGRARHGFAAMLVGQTGGAVLWIGAAGLSDRLLADGLQPFADPGRLILVDPQGPDDLLWSVETALASGVAGLVVADLAEVPGAEPMRRLAHAAEAGSRVAPGGLPLPLGLLLTPDGTAPGADSSWRMTPVVASGPDMALSSKGTAGALHWRLDRLRSPGDPPAGWPVTRGPTGRITRGDPLPPGG